MATSATAGRASALSRFVPGAVAALALPRRGLAPPGAAPAPGLDRRHAVLRGACARGGQARARVDRRRPRTRWSSARPRRRRRCSPTAPTCSGRAHAARPVEGRVNAMTPKVRRPTSCRSTESAEQRAWYWYDWANSAYYTTVLSRAVRAVHDHRRRPRGRLRRRRGRTCDKTVERAGSAPGRGLAAVLPDQLRHHRSAPSCCPWSARWWTGRRARSCTWPASPGRAPSSPPCCSS